MRAIITERKMMTQISLLMNDKSLITCVFTLFSEFVAVQGLFSSNQFVRK